MTFHGKHFDKPCSAGCGRKRDIGYSTMCRECRSTYMRENRPRHRELSEEARKRANCRAYTKVLILRGELIRQPCEDCGTTEGVEAHHDDYDKPREVRWKCKRHHRQHHRRTATVCGHCQGPADRPGQSYCRSCHTAYMRRHRANAVAKSLKTLRAKISRLESVKVDDPLLSALIGEDVVARQDVLTAIDEFVAVRRHGNEDGQSRPTASSTT